MQSSSSTGQQRITIRILATLQNLDDKTSSENMSDMSISPSVTSDGARSDSSNPRASSQTENGEQELFQSHQFYSKPALYQC
jgi:hypothetical protein